MSSAPKTTLRKAITEAWGIPLVFAEGNAELTPARLLGHHNPARMLFDVGGERVSRLAAELAASDAA